MQNIPTQTITQPINTIPTITQPINTIPTVTQPLNTIPITTQPVTTLPLSTQPVLEPSLDPYLQGSTTPTADILTDSAPIRSDFGKIKCLEVLTFKEAELERTLQGDTTFAAVGNLQVLYFPNFDRFVLSLNDWKYPLLRRVPITAVSNNLAGGPAQYTLPSFDGFYTLRLTRLPHLEALQNFETILASNSRFSYEGTENILGRGLSPDDRFRGQVEPMGSDPYVGSVGEIPPDMQMSTTSTLGGPTALTRGDRIKRGFKKVGYKLTKGLSTKGKHNLNHLQVRDLDSIKRTSEITVPTHLYPRREVERWITYAKEISSRNGFEPELGPDGLASGPYSPTFYESGRMRGYGSVDLGQGSVSAPFSSRTLAMGITSERPLTNNLYSSTSGTISGSHHAQVSYSKPSKMDKIKAKLPGTHHYHGEKVDGYTYGAFSNPTHPGVIDKVKTAIVRHEPFPHQSLAGPMGITEAQSVYTHGVTHFSQGIPGSTGAPLISNASPVYTTTSAPIQTHTTPIYTNTAPIHTTTTPVYSSTIQPTTVIPSGTVYTEPQHTGFFSKLKDKLTGHHHTTAETIPSSLPTNMAGPALPTQIPQMQSMMPQTTLAPVQRLETQGQGIINNTVTRIQNNVATHVPTQHVEVMRAQEYLAHDQA